MDLAGMSVVGRRARPLPAPPDAVWVSITDPHRTGTRPWLDLRSDEVEPRVLESDPPRLVVWSSPWPRHPDDVIRIDIEPAGDADGGGSLLRWTHLTRAPLPDASHTGYLRHRLNHLFFADLRFSYGQ